MLKKLSYLCVMLGFALGGSTLAQEESEEVLRAKIMQAWKTREAKVKSAKIEWKEFHWKCGVA